MRVRSVAIPTKSVCPVPTKCVCNFFNCHFPHCQFFEFIIKHWPFCCAASVCSSFTRSSASTYRCDRTTKRNRKRLEYRWFQIVCEAGPMCTIYYRRWARLIWANKHRMAKFIYTRKMRRNLFDSFNVSFHASPTYHKHTPKKAIANQSVSRMIYINKNGQLTFGHHGQISCNRRISLPNQMRRWQRTFENGKMTTTKINQMHSAIDTYRG